MPRRLLLDHCVIGDDGSGEGRIGLRGVGGGGDFGDVEVVVGGFGIAAVVGGEGEVGVVGQINIVFITLAVEGEASGGWSGGEGGGLGEVEVGAPRRGVEGGGAGRGGDAFPGFGGGGGEEVGAGRAGCDGSGAKDGGGGGRGQATRAELVEEGRVGALGGDCLCGGHGGLFRGSGGAMWVEGGQGRAGGAGTSVACTTSKRAYCRRRGVRQAHAAQFIVAVGATGAGVRAVEGEAVARVKGGTAKMRWGAGGVRCGVVKGEGR